MRLENTREGFIVVNKPKGITSFGVISFLRKKTGIKKIGHCGTLDPLATGVLICALGRSATKRIDEFKDKSKEYVATIELGKVSDTYDMEGNIIEKKVSQRPQKKDVIKILNEFIGEVSQSPPIFSAKKINGVRAYRLARAGKKVKMKKNNVLIEKIILIGYRWPEIKIRVKCGKGTYIRSLANDIGKKLVGGGILTDLIRTKIGSFSLRKSIQLEEITPHNWQKYLIDEIKIEKIKNYCTKK